MPALPADLAVFCAACQDVKTQKVVKDKNSEVVATCECGRFAKFPASAADDLTSFFASHEAANRRA